MIGSNKTIDLEEIYYSERFTIEDIRLFYFMKSDRF